MNYINVPWSQPATPDKHQIIMVNISFWGHHNSLSPNFHFPITGIYSKFASSGKAGDATGKRVEL